MSIEIRGIDVSKHQGANIAWNKVKAAGKDFVFVRAGWCGYNGYIQANGGLDTRFAANVAGAYAAGLHVGIYVYSYATTVAAAKIAAREVVSLIKDYTITYPVVFDMEDTETAKYNKNSKATNTAIALAFLQEIEQAGYTPMMYTYKSFAENYLNMADLADYDFWLAQYAAKPTYAGDFTIWQYTGSGAVDGITGDVDLNIAYKDYASTDTGSNPDEGSEGEEETPEENTGEETGSEEIPDENAGPEEGSEEEVPGEEIPTEENFWSKLFQWLNEFFSGNA